MVSDITGNVIGFSHHRSITAGQHGMSVRSSCVENRWISLGNSVHVSESTSSEYVITR